MTLDLGQKFAAALPYPEFLARHGTDTDLRRWRAVGETIQLTPVQSGLLHGFQREMRILCMAGAWCGDCARQCPIFHRFELGTPQIKLRFIDRDTDIDLATRLNLCGAARVPQVLFLSEEDKFVGRYGDRTLSAYRQMAHELTADDRSNGFSPEPDSLFHQVIQDWLDEFERIQLILRTSPHLRRIHGD